MNDSPSVSERDAVLRERAAFQACWYWSNDPGSGMVTVEDESIRRYPLPVRRVPREEPDPHQPNLYWRVAAGQLEVLYPYDLDRWVPANQWKPTPNRAALWHSLFETPDREVSE